MSTKRRRVAGGVSGRDSRGHLTWRRTTGKASGRKSRNALVAVPRNKIGFPQSMSTKLRYCDSVDLTPNSSSINSVSYLANGLFDPQVAVGGHQPRGFDEFMEIYKKFTVKGATISVTFCYEGYLGATPAGAATGGPDQRVKYISTSSSIDVYAIPAAVCLVQPSTLASMSGTLEQHQEMEKTRWKTMVSSAGPVVVSHALKCQDFFGKDFLVGADGYTGDKSSDPSNKLYFHVSAGMQTNEYPQGQKIRANICITYDAVFTEPEPLAAS